MADEATPDKVAADRYDQQEDHIDFIMSLVAIAVDMDDANEVTASHTTETERIEASIETEIDQPPRASLLGLPVEIRLLIYEYLLVPSVGEQEDDFFYGHLYPLQEGCSIRFRVYPEILATCKKICNEGFSILYAEAELNMCAWMDSVYAHVEFKGRAQTVEWELPSGKLPVNCVNFKVVQIGIGCEDASELRRLFRRVDSLPNLQQIIVKTDNRADPFYHQSAFGKIMFAPTSFKKYLEKEVRRLARKYLMEVTVG